MRCYLLTVEEFNRDSEAERLRERAMKKLDGSRLEKVRRSRTGTARDLALGAGLVLQLAVQEGMRQEQSGMSCAPGAACRPDRVCGTAMGTEKLPILTVSETLERLGDPVPVAYCYGLQGKPDFAQSGWHFNLSHSGRYVCCVLDREEVGVDLQQMKPLEGRNPGGRFFSSRESVALADCADEAERERLFYRIWVRKESYAKLTGEGIAAVLARDVSELEKLAAWRESELPGRYRMAICQYLGRNGTNNQNNGNEE